MAKVVSFINMKGGVGIQISAEEPIETVRRWKKQYPEKAVNMALKMGTKWLAKVTE